MRPFLLRLTICLAASLACGLAALPVAAQGKTKDIAAVWVEQLVLDGYDDIELSRTWLGRTRIRAEKGEIEREIILNPRTGEVLRDYSRAEDGTLRLPLGFEVKLEDDDDDDD